MFSAAKKQRHSCAICPFRSISLNNLKESNGIIMRKYRHEEAIHCAVTLCVMDCHVQLLSCKFSALYLDEYSVPLRFE